MAKPKKEIYPKQQPQCDSPTIKVEHQNRNDQRIEVKKEEKEDTLKPFLSVMANTLPMMWYESWRIRCLLPYSHPNLMAFSFFQNH